MVKRRIVSALLVMMLVFLCVMSSACQKQSEGVTIEKMNEIVLKQGEYQIYYLNNNKTTLKSKVIKVENAGDVHEMAKELISHLNEALKAESADATTQMNVLNTLYIGDILTVDLDKSFLANEGVSGILLRACMVLTLTQIEGVTNIEITVNGQTMKDETGNKIGKMKAADFVNFKDHFPDAKKEVTLVLYYANEEGTMLKKKELICYYDYTNSYEEFLINKLLEGVTEEDVDNGYKSALPKDTVIDMVYTKNGVCYVDFDESILDTIRTVPTELMLYSIINSLSELSDVTKVQFSVEGESDVTLYNEYDLSEPFSRNLDLLIKEVEENK